MAKRPWLLSPLGMRVSAVLVFAVSIAAIAPVLMQFAIEQERQSISQLDPKAITYCELEACDRIEKLAGLKINPVAEITETEYGTEVKIRVINSGRLVGEREVWAQVRTKDGALVEGMRTSLRLTDQGPQFVKFFFSGNPRELEGLRLFLGF